jgi:hypothetical protein
LKAGQKNLPSPIEACHMELFRCSNERQVLGKPFRIMSIPEYMTFVHVVRLGNNA